MKEHMERVVGVTSEPPTCLHPSEQVYGPTECCPQGRNRGRDACRLSAGTGVATGNGGGGVAGTAACLRNGGSAGEIEPENTHRTALVGQMCCYG